MTPDSIRTGFERLRRDDEMQPLANAASCRSEADWLIGINGTRAMTAFNSKSGGFYLTPVGRVQTPTLAVVVEREKETPVLALPLIVPPLLFVTVKFVVLERYIGVPPPV